MQTWLVIAQTVTYMYSGSVLMSLNTLHVIDQLLSEYFQLARNVLFSERVLSVNLT